MYRRARSVILIAPLFLACGRGAATHVPVARLDTNVALATFDTAWSRIGATYYDTTFRGHDWRALRATYRPLAERARTPDDLRSAVESLFVHLEDSHFSIIPGDVVSALRSDSTGEPQGPPGDAGLDFRLMDGRVVVSDMSVASSARAAGVRTGFEVVRIGRTDVASLLEALQGLESVKEQRAAAYQVPFLVQQATHGVVGTSVPATFRTPEGREMRVDLARTPIAGQMVKYLSLPPMEFRFAHEKYLDERGCVGVIRFSVWMIPLLPALERAMEDLNSCRGLVLDLRGNTGGVAALVMGVSAFLVDRDVTLGTWTGRTNTLRYVVNPRRSNRRGEATEPFTGAVAILVDRLSASTTEIFAEGMRDIGRARIFGDTTAGKALPAAMSKLPNGDLLIHAIADYRSASGKRIEASGVAPDEVLPATRPDLLAGRDRALAASLAWVRNQPVETAVGVTRTALRP